MSYLGVSLDSIWDEKYWGSDAYSFANTLFRLQPNAISFGTLDSSFDKDWYQLDVRANHQYEIHLTSDSYLYGWNSYRNGQFLEFDVVDSLGSIQLNSITYSVYDDKLIFDSPRDGTYYVNVHGLEFSPADYATTVQETYTGPQNNQPIFSVTGFTSFGDNDGQLEVGERLYFDVTGVVDLDGIASSVIEEWIGRDPNTGNLSTFGQSNLLTVTQDMLGMQIGYGASFVDGLGNTETYLEYFSQNVSKNDFDNLNVSDPLQFREYFGSDANDSVTGASNFAFFGADGDDSFYSSIGAYNQLFVGGGRQRFL